VREISLLSTLEREKSFVTVIRVRFAEDETYAREVMNASLSQHPNPNPNPNLNHNPE